MNYSGKRKYVLLHWQRLIQKSLFDFLQWALMIITLIGSLFAFIPEENAGWLHNAVHYLWTHPAVDSLILLAVLVGAVVYNWPVTRAYYKDKDTDLKVVIECCDLLRQEGMKVIHAVDTFDTELGTIISPRSLHGAFLQLCAQKHVDVDKLTDAALAHLTPVRTNEELPGRKAQYELGTICPVEVDGEPFCCLAFTRLQPNGTIAITKEEYVRCLKQLWRNLSDPRYRNDTVNVAVMGNKFVDLPSEFSTEQKIDLMIQTFFAISREKTCCRTLRICVHPDNAPDIDFQHYALIIAHLAKRPVL